MIRRTKMGECNAKSDENINMLALKVVQVSQLKLSSFTEKIVGV
jgi:hypothetical protein